LNSPNQLATFKIDLRLKLPESSHWRCVLDLAAMDRNLAPKVVGKRPVGLR
jgi:hypothetical protein